MASAVQEMLSADVDTGMGGEGPIDAIHVYAMPATQGQIRFWSLDQLNPGNPALNMPLMWQCTGDLDLEALAQAFSLCARRHESPAHHL